MCNNPSSFAFFLDGSPIEGGTYGAYKTGSDNTGQVIVKATAGSVLTLRHSPTDRRTSGSDHLALQVFADIGRREQIVNASIVILKVGL